MRVAHVDRAGPAASSNSLRLVRPEPVTGPMSTVAAGRARAGRPGGTSTVRTPASGGHRRTVGGGHQPASTRRLGQAADAVAAHLGLARRRRCAAPWSDVGAARPPPEQPGSRRRRRCPGGGRTGPAPRPASSGRRSSGSTDDQEVVAGPVVLGRVRSRRHGHRSSVSRSVSQPRGGRAPRRARHDSGHRVVVRLRPTRYGDRAGTTPAAGGRRPGCAASASVHGRRQGHARPRGGPAAPGSPSAWRAVRDSPAGPGRPGPAPRRRARPPSCAAKRSLDPGVDARRAQRRCPTMADRRGRVGARARARTRRRAGPSRGSPPGPGRTRRRLVGSIRAAATGSRSASRACEARPARCPGPASSSASSAAATSG